MLSFATIRTTSSGIAARPEEVLMEDNESGRRVVGWVVMVDTVTFFPPLPDPVPKDMTFREDCCEEGSGVDVRVE